VSSFLGPLYPAVKELFGTIFGESRVNSTYAGMERLAKGLARAENVKIIDDISEASLGIWDINARQSYQ